MKNLNLTMKQTKKILRQKFDLKNIKLNIFNYTFCERQRFFDYHLPHRKPKMQRSIWNLVLDGTSFIKNYQLLPKQKLQKKLIS